MYDRPCDGDPVLAYTFSFTTVMKTLNISSLARASWSLGLGCALALVGYGQAVTVTPSPTALQEEVTLTIDVSKSEEHGLKTILEANPICPSTSGRGPQATRGDQRFLEQQLRRMSLTTKVG